MVQALRFPGCYQVIKCPSPLRTVFQPSILQWQCGTNVLSTWTSQDWPQDKASSWHTEWEVRLEGPSLGRFSPKQAVEAWWKDCKTVSRPDQGPCKQYAPWQAPHMGIGTSAIEQESEGELPFCFSLLEWDAWFGDTDSTDSNISYNWTPSTVL